MAPHHGDALPDAPVQRPARVHPDDGVGELPASLTTVTPGDADVALLGVPFDGTSGRQPLQAHAPGVLRRILFRDATGGDTQPVATWEAGDVDVDPVDPEAAVERTRRVLERVTGCAPDALPVLLGGEHTVTLAAAQALEPAAIVSLDAHPDLWADQHGHRVAQGTWLRRAVEEIGCRTVLPMARAARGAEVDAIEALGVHTALPEGLPEPVYLTIDVDVFDPEHAPSVVYPEPDGPAPEQVLDLVRGIAGRYELAGVDLVEVNANRVGPTAGWGAVALATAVSAAVAGEDRS